MNSIAGSRKPWHSCRAEVPEEPQNDEDDDEEFEHGRSFLEFSAAKTVTAESWSESENRSRVRPPPPDPPTIGLVIFIKCPPQRGLLVQHDEQVGDNEERTSIGEQRNRLIEERGAG